MNKAYSRVIDLIAVGEIDWRRVGLELAKAFPEAFLAICDNISAAPIENANAMLDAELLSLLKVSGKVEAVKWCRQKTGKGLKEAKDYVDALERRQRFRPPELPEGRPSLAEMLKIQFAVTGDAPKKTYQDEGTF